MTTLDYILTLNMCRKTDDCGVWKPCPNVEWERSQCTACSSMSMRSVIAALILMLVVSFIASPVSAQKGIDISGAIRTGKWNPYKIAVGDFKVVGDWSLAADSLAATIKKVVTDDLDFHVFFDTITVNQFYIDVWEIKDLTPDVWARMGADYLADGTLELKGDDVVVAYRISELHPQVQEMKSEKLRTKRGNIRRIAHMVGDAAVRQIAAEKPFFTTKIAYACAASGRKEVWLCDYDGANAMQLTNDQSIALSPCWDRKEDKLLYTTFKHGSAEVWELDIRSGKSRSISAYPGINSAPSISPSNDEIAITLSKDGNPDLYILNRKGEVKRRLTDLPSSIESGASWSPTGQEIIFSSDRTGTPQIYRVDPDGIGITRLTYEGKYNDSPDYSPLGDAIVYVARGEDGDFQICTIDTKGSDFSQLDQTGSNENPHWSPDGWHVVLCKQVGVKYDLYIMDRFKKKIKKITSDGKSSNPAWQPFAD
jgi:TolB protein